MPRQLTHHPVGFVLTLNVLKQPPLPILAESLEENVQWGRTLNKTFPRWWCCTGLTNNNYLNVIKSITLESGIDVAPGKFGKNNKFSPNYTLHLYYLNKVYEVHNKAVAPEKKVIN